MLAILNDEAEHDFVVESQRVLSNDKSYWIGGSAQTTGDIDFLHDATNTTGNTDLLYSHTITSGEINLS